MANWFYYNENGEKIQVTGEHLKRLAKNGHITPDTVVENEEGKRARAGKVKGLKFAEAVQTKTPKVPVATKDDDVETRIAQLLAEPEEWQREQERERERHALLAKRREWEADIQRRTLGYKTGRFAIEEIPTGDQNWFDQNWFTRNWHYLLALVLGISVAVLLLVFVSARIIPLMVFSAVSMAFVVVNVFLAMTVDVPQS